jgi:hypothetical protein
MIISLEATATSYLLYQLMSNLSLDRIRRVKKSSGRRIRLAPTFMAIEFPTDFPS